ncbi:hypothetical protein [Sagittula salina]|uniref:DUF1127 domain-containing protein n=1 Tax=Sagittula salina TaxID=2820268 RepID=A0A940MQX0_9RHOB|nr:hypothetical protein [Sagittula salina]MBP0484185.1 hypothetical protein [Sagittula salina]
MTRDNVQLCFGQAALSSRIDRFLVERGLGFNPYALRRARLRDIIVLESQNDRELAAIGLSRDQILPYVFRDLLSD